MQFLRLAENLIEERASVFQALASDPLDRNTEQLLGSFVGCEDVLVEGDEHQGFVDAVGNSTYARLVLPLGLERPLQLAPALIQLIGDHRNRARYNHKNHNTQPIL